MIQTGSLGWSLPFQEHIPNERDRFWIQNIARQLPFLADFIPADLLIHCPTGDHEQFVTVAESKPTVRQSFYRRPQVGLQFVPEQNSSIWQAYHSGDLAVGPMGKVVNGQPMNQVAYPLVNDDEQVVAILVVERNLYEELKHSESKRQLYRTAITRVVKTLIDKAKISSIALPPMLPGDAPMIPDGLCVNEFWPHGRLAQSIAFLRPQGIERLYSGDTNRIASAAAIASFSARPSGR